MPAEHLACDYPFLVMVSSCQPHSWLPPAASRVMLLHAHPSCCIVVWGLHSITGYGISSAAACVMLFQQLQVPSATRLGVRQSSANNGTCGGSWCFLSELQTESVPYEQACREYIDKVRRQRGLLHWFTVLLLLLRAGFHVCVL
jgi:hypothetical protein